jgi:hypothetical protein
LECALFVYQKAHLSITGINQQYCIKSALFVYQKAHLNITGINQQYCIKSTSATMGTRRQASNGCNRLSIILQDNSDMAMCAALCYKADESADESKK